MKTKLVLLSLLLLSATAHAGFVFHGPPAPPPHYVAPDGTWIYFQIDGQGRVTSASGTDAYHVTRSMSVDWSTNTIGLTEAGVTIYNHLAVNGDHIVIHDWATNGMELYYDIDCTYGADVAKGFVHRWWIYSNGALVKSAYLPAQTNASALPSLVRLMTEETFGYNIDQRYAYFKPIYDDVQAARSEALRRQAGGDPVVAAGLATQTLRDLAGASGRGVVWGLATLGGVLIVATAPISITAGAGLFFIGFDASMYSDIVTDVVKPAPVAQSLGGSDSGDGPGGDGDGDSGGGREHCVTMVKTDGTTETRCTN